MRCPQLLATGTATINMTPMIDVVFLLIIFFLVSSHLAKQENAVRLDLPEAVSALDETEDGALVIVNVMADGSWQTAGRPIVPGDLADIFQQRLSNLSEPLRLKIRTDKSVPYSRIEPVLEEATAAGIGDIGFSVYEQRPR